MDCAVPSTDDNSRILVKINRLKVLKCIHRSLSFIKLVINLVFFEKGLYFGSDVNAFARLRIIDDHNLLGILNFVDLLENIVLLSDRL